MLVAIIKFLFLNKPYVLIVETGTICNIDCPTCPTPRKIISRERTAQNMDFDNFKQIINNSHKFFAAVVLYWSNEPFLNKDLVKMVRYCNELNLYTFISTNMTLLTEKKFKELIQAGLDELLVCVDGFSSKTFEHFRKGAKFETVKRNVEIICKIKKELKAVNPWIEIQYIETKQNSEEIASCKEWATEIGINRFRLQDLYISRHLTDYKKLRDEFYTEKMWEKRYYEKLQTGKKTCKTPDTQVCVLVNGQITICCNDIKGICSYGNLLNDSFKNIRKNEKYSVIKRRGKKRDLSICKGC
jgi:MoaA/NifB/PqqE/SkfB family radical SAM enzyme